MGDWQVQQAAEVIKQGGVVAYPTEAVYGLGCDPADEDAVMQLLEIKQRPVHKGLILLGADLEQLLPWITLTPQQHAQLSQQWPVGTTYLIEASPRVPTWIRGAHHKVAVRVSAHPVASELARRAGTAVVSTSANLSGRPALRDTLRVQRQLGNWVDFIVVGQCDVTAQPSTIIDLETGQTLRP